MKPKVIHYSGRLHWIDKRGFSNTILPGWAACCYGRQAETVRRQGNQTHDPKYVTCVRCRQRMTLAGVLGDRGSTPAHG